MLPDINIQSIGTPLDPTFANYYMCEIENNALATLTNKPAVYCRYVNDCFLMIRNISQIEAMKDLFEEPSVLKFTYEIEIKRKLQFMDVLLTRQRTTPYFSVQKIDQHRHSVQVTRKS